MRIVGQTLQFDSNERQKRIQDIERSFQEKGIDEPTKSVTPEEKVCNELIADTIAKKIARGEIVSENELKKLKSIDAEKLRKAKLANEKRIKIELKLKQAKSRQEGTMIVSNETMLAKHTYDHSDKDFGYFYTEAVGKAAINNSTKAQVLANRVNESKHVKARVIDVKR